MLKSLKIGNLTATLPLIQGGMGVGVSLSSLAGAVAKEGGIGIISTAQIGFDQADFDRAPILTNLKAIGTHIRKAKELAGIYTDTEGNRHGAGMVGVNIMVATKSYPDYVKAAAEAGADVIISGAGLPVSLPEYITGYDVKIAPIVSSDKAAKIILKMWDRKYNRTADFIVIENAHAGGHLGFSSQQLADMENPSFDADYDAEVGKIIATTKEYAEKYHIEVPVILAGGIMDKADADHAFSLGVDGIQVATPFVPTVECDADDAFKQVYIDAKEEDIQIIESPVGMPARAIKTPFLERVYSSPHARITHCFQCLEHCNPATAPYCITKALIHAVQGDMENGLVFCGDNASKINKMSTVHEVITNLFA